MLREAWIIQIYKPNIMVAKSISGWLLIACGLLAGCGFVGSSAGDGTVTVIEKGGVPFTICDGRSVKDIITIPLSDLLEDCKLVRFENSDTALFKFGGMAISDHYIGILNSEGAFKLFDRDGKYLCDVGAKGQGPGEYLYLYDAAIDESNKCIYLVPFSGSSKIWKYDLNGLFTDAIDFGEELHKAKINVNQDGTLSVAHLYFKGLSSFSAAHVAKDGTITKCVPPINLQIETRDKEGRFCGFNQEVFAYQNMPDLSVSITTTDTLYSYQPQKNTMEPRFIMTWSAQKKPFRHYIELPNYFITSLADLEAASGWDLGTVFVDKAKKTSSYVTLKNDFFGDMDAPISFYKGHFFAAYEPYALSEEIEKRLRQSDCSGADRRLLEKLKASINEDDNCYMFVGKLKE